MNALVPDRISVTVDPTFWNSFIACLTLIRYQGVFTIVHAIFPLAGLFMLGLSIRVGHGLDLEVVLLTLLAFLFTPLMCAFAVWNARCRNRLAQGPFIYSFDSQGMHTSGTTFTQTINWAAIRRVRQSKRFLFIFISPISAYYIPLSALRDQGVLDEVRGLVGKYADLR